MAHGGVPTSPFSASHPHHRPSVITHIGDPTPLAMNMNPRGRRQQNIHQSSSTHSASAAQPFQFGIAQPLTSTSTFNQDSWSPGGYIDIDTQPTTPYPELPHHLTLTVPGNGNGFLSSNWLSPTSPYTGGSPASPSTADGESMLPSYARTVVDSSDFEWKHSVVDVDMPLVPVSGPFASSPTQYAPVDTANDPDLSQMDGSNPPSYSSSSSGGKQRSAHRRAIEEKSNIKRKNAEHRLSHAITQRLGGSFVPGLANQLNQAAELLESDMKKIKELEAENRELRRRLDIKVPVLLK